MATPTCIEMTGLIVKTWPWRTIRRLLDNGDLMDSVTNFEQRGRRVRGPGLEPRCRASYDESRTTDHPHGDFQRIYNPKLGAYQTLYLANKGTHDATEYLLPPGVPPLMPPTMELRSTPSSKWT